MASRGAGWRTYERDGFEILVGKGARENDQLTFRVAAPDDLWLHASGQAGSHVLVRNPDRLPRLPPEVIECAARLAAFHSKARDARGKIEVHLCRAADVRKPGGFAPGKVEIRRWESVRVYPRDPFAAPSSSDSMPTSILAPLLIAAALAAAPLRAQSPATAIAIGETVAGEIAATDPLLEDGTRYDSWRFRGLPGQTVEIVMESADFDAFLVLRDTPGESATALATNDDGAGGTNARIVTPTSDRDYWISANTLQRGETGAYTLRLALAVQVAPRAISAGDTLSESLSESDPVAADDTYYDEYAYEARAGERILVDLTSDDFDTYLVLGEQTPAGFRELASNDDNHDGGTHSTIVYTIGSAGTYLLRANSLGKETGSYRLSLRSLSR